MPEKETLEKAEQDKEEGKAPEYSSGRICSRRNRACARRKTRRAID